MVDGLAALLASRAQTRPLALVPSPARGDVSFRFEPHVSFLLKSRCGVGVSVVWWRMPIISVLGRLRQEDYEPSSMATKQI